jgi:hypothetical protein
MALEAFRGKWSFQQVLVSICGILEWLEGFGVKDGDSYGVWKIFRNFCGFLKWFRT